MNKQEERSISQLEGWQWKSEIPNEENYSWDEYNFYLLHTKPLKDYTMEDILFSIRQKSGLRYMIPWAIDLLNDDLLLEAECYKGDLLQAMLDLSKNNWKDNQDMYNRFNNLILSNRDMIESFIFSDGFNRSLRDSLKNFLNINI